MVDDWLTKMAMQGMVSWIARYGEHMLNHSWAITLENFQYDGTVLTLKFDLDLSQIISETRLSQILWKSDLYFFRNHNKRNERTNQPTNQQTHVMTLLLLTQI